MATRVEVQTPRRTDSWDPQDDEFLAKLVIDAIRKGGTQLDAFQMAAKHLKRTPGACGFRWNGRLRRSYRIEVEDAKRERKTKIRIRTRTQPVQVDPSFAMKDAVEFLKGISHECQRLRDRVQTLTAQRDQLKVRVNELEQNLKAREPEVPSTPEQIQQDARQLAEITLRARKLLGEPK